MQGSSCWIHHIGYQSSSKTESKCNAPNHLPCPVMQRHPVIHLLAIRTPWSGIGLIFQPEITEGTSRPPEGTQETKNEKSAEAASEADVNTRMCSVLGCRTKRTKAPWRPAPRTYFGVGVQEEAVQTWSMSQSHTSWVAVTNVCYCYTGDPGISGKVFWVVANEAITVEDIRCNRMFF